MEFQPKLIVSEHGDRFETLLVMETSEGDRVAVFILGTADDEETAYQKGYEIQERIGAIWRE